MQLHELKPTQTQPSKKRVGRGGKRGKTAGRGHKGQLARAGNSTRPEMREHIKKLPKLRGHGTNRARTVNAERVKPVAVNLDQLEAAFAAEAAVNPKTLVAVGVVSAVRKQAPMVKILARGSVSKPLVVTGCTVSKAAKAQIEAAGGTVGT